MWIIALQFSRLSYTLLFSSTMILVREGQLKKAHKSIFVTPAGIVIEVRDSQSSNAFSSIVVTPLGIVIDERDLQNENAILLIFVTLSGILIVVRDLQPLYLQPVITQYFASNKSEIWS